MQVFWEKVGILGPVYRLAGQGLARPQKSPGPTLKKNKASAKYFLILTGGK